MMINLNLPFLVVGAAHSKPEYGECRNALGYSSRALTGTAQAPLGVNDMGGYLVRRMTRCSAS